MFNSETTTRIVETPKPQTVLDAFLGHVNTAPVHLLAGAHGETQTISRGEIYGRGCALARKFRYLGVEPGDNVMTILPTGKPFLVSVFGAWCAGAAIVPVAAPPTSGNTTDHYQSKLASMIRTAEPKIIVACETVLAALKRLPEITGSIVILRDMEVLFDFAGEHDAPYTPHPNDLAHIQFTSGSTDSPKAAAISHRQLAANVEQIGRVMMGNDSMEKITVGWLPVHHDMGFIGSLMVSFFHGIELNLIPTETFIRNPAIWLKTISDVRATLSPAPTFAYDLLASRVSEIRLQGIDLSSWQYGWVGAEPIFSKTLQKFNERFCRYGLPEATLKPCYGLAEATLAVTLTPFTDSYKTVWINQQTMREKGFAEAAFVGAPNAVEVTCCGVPIEGMEILIAADDGSATEERNQGKVLVRGSSVMNGYLGNVASPIDAEGWLETGDLGFKIGEEIYITGRAKDLIIRGGVNIHPQEIEKIADSVEGVRMGTAAAFSCFRHEHGREEIVLVVETRQKQPEARAKIIEQIQNEVAKQGRIQLDHIEFFPAGTVPKTTSGKIQRNITKQMFLNKQMS